MKNLTVFVRNLTSGLLAFMLVIGFCGNVAHAATAEAVGDVDRLVDTFPDAGPNPRSFVAMELPTTGGGEPEPITLDAPLPPVSEAVPGLPPTSEGEAE